jgi:phosphoenolpyruvate phosphomutase
MGTDSDSVVLDKSSQSNRSSASRGSALRAQMFAPELAFLMEAHNGMSAKIAEEAGFKGLWASGLTISASLGLRDSNEASWTQVLDVLEYMADATTLPILVDGDTGYGNFNNVRRLVRKLCDTHIAGVCIEDKLFPKTNSFIGERQPLADVEEFCGRIKAGKDSQTDDDFILVARVEALISGHSMEEALHRAEAYHAAGADAILIHSKRSTATEILEFTERWGNRAPLVIVPTMYSSTPTQVFRDAGISTIIWANHNLRSAVSAMRETSKRIFEDQSLAEVEGRVVPVKELFRLVGNAELEAAERRYLPGKANLNAVVLAASGGNLGDLTESKPKCMIDIRGQSLLQRLVTSLSNGGVPSRTPCSWPASRPSTMTAMPRPASCSPWLVPASASRASWWFPMATCCSATTSSTGSCRPKATSSSSPTPTAARAIWCPPTCLIPAAISTTRRSS